MISMLSLKYYVVVAEELSFSAAAKRLYISQQTLSEKISQIEKYLGVKLFVRTRPIALTDPGKRFLLRAKEILYTNSQLEKEMQAYANPEKNEIRIGISHAYARSLLPELMSYFYLEYPRCSVEVFESSYENMANYLNNNQVDFIFTRPLIHSLNTSAIHLNLDDNIYVYAPRLLLEEIYKDDLEKIINQLKKGKGIGVLRDCPFIIPRKGHVREVALKIFNDHKLNPNIRMETETLETALAMCHQGLGITVSLGTLLHNFMRGDEDNVKSNSYMLSDKYAEYKLDICYRSDMYLSPEMKAFLKIVRERLENVGN